LKYINVYFHEFRIKNKLSLHKVFYIINNK